jgi:hypothetical protein
MQGVAITNPLRARLHAFEAATGRFAPLLVIVAVWLLCFWSWAEPGMVMSHDMSFPPNEQMLASYVKQGLSGMDLHAITGGVRPTAPTITAEYWLPLLLLSHVISYEMATKMFVAGPLLLAALIAYLYFRVGFRARRSAAVAAAILVGFNPWIFEQIAVGHVFIVGPYWLIVAAGLQTALWWERSDARLLFGQQLMLALLFPLQQHFFIIFQASTVAGIVAKSLVNTRNWRLMLFPIAGLLCSAWTFFNTFLYYSGGAVWYSPAQEFFSTSRFSGLLNVLAMKSSWVAPYDGVMGHGFLAVLLGVLSPVAGLWLVITRAIERPYRYLCVVGAVAVILAMGARAPLGLGAAQAWAVGHLPIVNAFRDPNKWVLLLLLVLGISAARPFGAGVLRGASWLAIAFLVLASLAPYATIGFRQQLRPVVIPRAYAEALGKVDDLPAGVVLVLPMIPEMQYTWSAAPIRLPLYYYSGRQSLVTNDFFLGGNLREVVSQLNTDLWSQHDLGLAQAEINTLAVRYLLVDTDTEPSWIWESQLASISSMDRLKLLFRSGSILVFECQDARERAIYPGAPAVATFGSPTGLMQAELLQSSGEGAPLLSAAPAQNGTTTLGAASIGPPGGLSALKTGIAVQVPVGFPVLGGVVPRESRYGTFPSIPYNEVKQSTLPVVLLSEGTADTVDGKPVWQGDGGQIVLNAFVPGPFGETALVRVNDIAVSAPSHVVVTVNGAVVAQAFVAKTGSIRLLARLIPLNNSLVLTATPVTALAPVSIRTPQSVIVLAPTLERVQGVLSVQRDSISVLGRQRQLTPAPVTAGVWSDVDVPMGSAPAIEVHDQSTTDRPLLLTFRLSGEARGFYFYPLFVNGDAHFALWDLLREVAPTTDAGALAVSRLTGYGIFADSDASHDARFGWIGVSHFGSTKEPRAPDVRLSLRGAVAIWRPINSKVSAVFYPVKAPSAKRPCAMMSRRGIVVSIPGHINRAVSVAVAPSSLIHEARDLVAGCRTVAMVESSGHDDDRISLDPSTLASDSRGNRQIILPIPADAAVTAAALVLGSGRSDVSFHGVTANQVPPSGYVSYDPNTGILSSSGAGVGSPLVPVDDYLVLCSGECTHSAATVDGFAAAWRLGPGTYRLSYSYGKDREVALYVSAVSTLLFLWAWWAAKWRGFRADGH